MASLVWRGVEVDGLERLRLSVGENVSASSVVDSARGRYAYELVCTSDWVFRSLRLEAAASERVLEITSDGTGQWSVDGAPRSDLADAVDIDLAISPFTNSLPIRRLDLAVGDEADLTVAYVSFPDLEVTTEEQRYTRTDEDLYLYESLDSDFSAEITVNANGIVTDYPGLFELL